VVDGISDFLGKETSGFRGHVQEGKNVKKAKNKKIFVVGQFRIYLFNRGKDVKKDVTKKKLKKFSFNFFF
jgi:hypothetical protein